ncbi:hypothetical protein H0H92_006836 [Tricholoma furcatifolium]|nr:hypothetical protein H0H92_006836 [Tricholoma furcatifolium]
MATSSVLIDQTSTALLVTQATYDETDDSTSFLGGTAIDISGAVLVQKLKLASGISASFYGQFPLQLTGGAVYPLNVTIDGGSEITSTSSMDAGIGAFYTTPTLSDGPHIVNLAVESVLLDYMIVITANDTQLQGQKLIIDDDDDVAFTYEGTWTQNQSLLLGSDGFDRFPYGGGMHQSSTPGAAVTLSFEGTSIVVYGVVGTWNTTTGLNIGYSMDGVELHYDWLPSAHNLNAETSYSANGGRKRKPSELKIDYALYTPSLASSVSTAVASSSGSSTPSPKPESQPVVSRLRAGTIVGVVISGVLVPKTLLVAAENDPQMEMAEKVSLKDLKETYD